MKYTYSAIVDISTYETQGLCDVIDLRRHEAADLEEIGTLRAQEDWRRWVGPVAAPYKGGLSAEFSLLSVSVPECLPERLEIISYANEFAFLLGDDIKASKDAHDTSNEEVLQAFEEGAQTGKIEQWGASGKHRIAARILRELLATDPQKAKIAVKSWTAFVRYASGRQHHVHFKTLEKYIAYRCLDVGYMFWQGLVTFGCAITIPEEEATETRELLTPALIASSLGNDLFSYAKEYEDTTMKDGLPEMINAILVIMGEHGCSEGEARELCKERIRVETAKYVKVVDDTRRRTDLSDDVKRYIEIMQYCLSGSLVWSTQCPRYNKGAIFNELQVLRAKHGLERYPARWSPKNSTNGEGPDDDKSLTQLSDSIKGRLVLGYVMSLAVDWNLPELSDDVVLQPYRYIASLPSKGFREQAIKSLNIWLKVPPMSAQIITELIKLLHTVSLMLDDLEDGSPLRRGRPSAHDIYGSAQTINSVTYQYVQVINLVGRLSNPVCIRIFTEEMQHLCVGQSYDLYWTYNAMCPSISEYLKMVDDKTGGLFRMLTRLMVAESPVDNELSGDELNMLSCLLGRFFQIRDDYQNLSSADYAKQKGFAEDLDEGKYSFALIHCIQILDSEPRFAGDAMQLRAFLMKRRLEGKLRHEDKQEVLGIMGKTNSLEYTLGVVKELHSKLEEKVKSLEASFGGINFPLRVLLEVLRL